MSSSVSPRTAGPAGFCPVRSPWTSAQGPAHRYTAFMLKGSKTAIVTKVQPVSIHGQISLDVYYHDPDDSQAQVRLARVGQESVPRGLEAGDRVELHYVLGVVTHITKA
jgi:hypothetical protein